MIELPDVKRIVAEYLVANGYDGLSSYENCGCLVDDLMPCQDSRLEHCEPSYRIDCDKSCENDICDFHMVTVLPKGKTKRVKSCATCGKTLEVGVVSNGKV